MGLKKSTYALENGTSTIAASLCYVNVTMLLLLPLHLPLLLSQLLSLPLPVNPTVSVVTPVAANTAFHLAICTLIIATYTGADDTIAIYFTKQSTAMTASLLVIYSELIYHFLLLF